MDTAAFQLGSRFVLGPNQLGYCGRGTAPEKFKRCIALGKCAGIGEELSKFIVFYPYLKTLAKVTGSGKYSYQTIEAYWLGNDQLKKARKSHYQNLLHNLAQQGVPDWLIKELKEKQPKPFIPFHLFQILHVGVGRASGAVPFNLDSINNCMVRWGEIVTVSKKQAKVELQSLKRIMSGGYSLFKKEELVNYSPRLVPGLKIGDVVAVHWKIVAKILTPEETKHLNYWTKRILSTVEIR